MATPTRDQTVAERVMDHLLQTVQGINRHAGYNTDFRSYHDMQFNAFFSKELPAIGLTLLDEVVDPENTVTMKEGRIVRVQIDVWDRERTKGQLQQQRERMIGDVIVATLADITRGGVARDTRLGDILRSETESSAREAGAAIFFDVLFRFREGAPTVLA